MLPRRRRGVLTALIVLGGLATVPTGLAHVDYVTPGGASTDVGSFLWAVLANPLNVALLGGGAVLVTGLILAWRAWGDKLADASVLGSRLDRYERFVPWMLRLSLGLPLVGAGFAGFLFTPVVSTGLRVPLVLVGFLLLLGLATRVAAVAGLVGWVLAFGIHGSSVLLAAEYVPGFVAIAVLGPGRPSVDDLLAGVASNPATVYHRFDPVHRWAERLQQRLAPVVPYTPTIVRAGLGAVFVFLGIHEKILTPGPALALANELGLAGWFGIEAGMWVLGAGLVEALVGTFLIAGFFTRATSAVAFAVLTVTLFALANDPVLPHVTLFGLTSVTFTLGAGPLSLDQRIQTPP